MKLLFLIRYDEIALKGNNRIHFEKRLFNNIKNKCLDRQIKFEIERKRGRLYLSGPGEEIPQILTTTPGIDSFSLAFAVEKKLNFITTQKKAIEFLLKQNGISLNKFTFKVECRREDKCFPMESYTICKELGSFVSNNFPGAKVQMKSPDFVLTIEIRHKIFFIGNKIPSLGGLPVGEVGEGLLLLSGGIDSPVAGIRMAIRGIDITTALHFHSYPYTSIESQDKVKQLADKLKQCSPGMELYFFNLTEIQKLVQKSSESKYWTILMRIIMIKIAQQFADKKKIRCLITGESLGQVASQTLESLICLDKSATIPIFRPLIGMNKKDIIHLAKKYQTYDISIAPYDDCCSLFNPSNPVTRPHSHLVSLAEQKITGLEKAIQHSLFKIEKVEFL